MTMEAKAQSFTFLSNEGKVKVPFFQRGYVWDDENWEDITNELFNSTKNPFLGSLILKQLKVPTGNPKELLIIDGQQRLTTLSILVKALYDTFPQSLKERCKSNVLNHLYYKEYATASTYLIKIQHSRVDAEDYQKVIPQDIDRSSSVLMDDNGSKILRCYRFFSDILLKKTKEEREALFNRIFDSENKMMVVIDLQAGDDEQAIFDAINSAGVRLSCADIIKNAIFQKAIQVFNSESRAIELYKKTWEKAFLEDEDTIRYWDAERLTGRLMRDNIEILLHCIAVIKGFYDPEKNTLSDLSKLYKEQIEKYKLHDELESFIHEIKGYADIYRNRVLAFDNSTLFSFTDATKRLFHILEVLQISTFHPFILFVFKTYDNNEQEASRLLFNLEKFIIRRMISKQETKSYNKLCKDFIVNAETIITKMSERMIPEVLDGLKGIPNNKNAALLLFWIELYRRSKDNKFDTKELKYNYSLEHVMPQKWEEYWKGMPKKKNTDGSDMSDEEAKRDRYNKIYWIGNMTLLTTSLNSSLRNYVFEKKVNGEGLKKGMKAYAALSITKDDIVSKFENGETVWDENKIIGRTSSLKQEIEQIWGIQK